jgi:hypothetical protein
MTWCILTMHAAKTKYVKKNHENCSCLQQVLPRIPGINLILNPYTWRMSTSSGGSDEVWRTADMAPSTGRV